MLRKENNALPPHFVQIVNRVNTQTINDLTNALEQIENQDENKFVGGEVQRKAYIQKLSAQVELKRKQENN